MSEAVRYVPDSVFVLSLSAWRGLVAEAKIAGMSAQRVLRDRAYRLSLETKPTFRKTSGEPVREVHVGIIPEVLDRLEGMCDRRGLPYESLGELIATWQQGAA